MRTKGRTALRVVAGLALFVATCASASAQPRCHDEEESAGTVEGSCYYHLTWYDTIKLGTAPFFNTELARRARIAYSFEEAVFSGDQGWETANKLYREGRLAPAGLTGNGAYWVQRRSSNQELQDAVSSLRQRGYSTVVFLGEDEGLPGLPDEIAGSAVVTWDAVPW